MHKTISDLEYAEHAVERKKRSKAVLEREIAALEELVRSLRRTDKEQHDAHED